MRQETSVVSNLDELEAALSRELDIYAYPDRIWPMQRTSSEGEHVFDVVIVGGGQAAIGTAVGLIRERIANILLLDENEAGEEGPWVTYARMITLRTTKNMPGPDADLLNASFRAWYEAQFGAQAWAQLNLVPKEQWMAYLKWLRRVMGIPVENNARVRRISPHRAGFQVEVEGANDIKQVLARKVVLATGLGGAGGPRIPSLVSSSVPKARWAHSSEMIDFETIRGKRVAVLGGNASAFDNSAAALEGGAAEVLHFVRRKQHPEVNTLRYLEFAGLFRNFIRLDDEWRLRFTRRMLDQGIPPPPYSIERCNFHPNFHLLMGCGWISVSEVDGGVEIVTTAGETHIVDFLILGTGFEVDLTRLDFLSELQPHIQLWRDRMQLGLDALDQEIGRHPYLGEGLQCISRSPDYADTLSNLHFANGGSLASVGPIFTGINGMPFLIRCLVEAISRDFFLSDVGAYWDEFTQFDRSDFEGKRELLASA
ncbi:hypothetical protein BB934_43670 (plasmid) [Microvirga ossetica]|uniref:Oxidoreductase n=1 Tax=Microvirga ossetica TaxID=1882682 RepID=A0A1B2EYT2_9HYPH|nr:hypothetical protein BB934_43670 [Microvirga ossetica]